MMHIVRTFQKRAAALDWQVASLLIAAAIVRVVWKHYNGGLKSIGYSGEALRVAQALADGRGFADSFYDGQGATAHLMPTMPLIAGAILWLLKSHRGISALVLVSWSLAQVLCAFFLQFVLFGRLEVPRTARLIGLALCALLPVYWPSEIDDFRVWEGGLAVCLVTINLLLMLSVIETKKLSNRHVALIGIAAATGFFVSPPAGFAVGLTWAAVTLKTRKWADTLKLGIATLLCSLLLMVPWAARNSIALGHPIFLRSDAGLEMAIGTYPGALSPDSNGRMFERRFNEIHPIFSVRARDAMRTAGGEFQYSENLQRATFSFIEDNPLHAVEIIAHHAWLFFFPKPWQFNFGSLHWMVMSRAWFLGVVDGTGLIGLAWGIWRREQHWGFVGIYFIAVPLPYLLVQPTPRYTYLVFGFLVYFGTTLVVSLLSVFRNSFGVRHRLTRI